MLNIERFYFIIDSFFSLLVPRSLLTTTENVLCDFVGLVKKVTDNITMPLRLLIVHTSMFSSKLTL